MSKILVIIIIIINCIVVDCARTKPRIFELARFIPNFELPSIFTLSQFNTNKNARSKRDITGTVGQIETNGYPAETHLIETEDGYILEVHRIPPIRQNQSQDGHAPLFPVLLIHGYLQSSSDWVINSPPNSSLAFMLSDLGYDVWLGNNRGNGYSKRHSKFPLNSNDFWDFSFHEMGQYDMPAIVDYIVKQTGKEKVHYIGFSHGATVLFTGLSSRPEYNAKIASGMVMGPSVFQAHYVNGLFNSFSFPITFLNAIIDNFGALPLIPPFLAQIIHSFLTNFCNPKFDIIGICLNFVRLVFGDDGNLITKDQLPLITSVAPSAVGLKGLAHTLQLAGSHRFAEYDYGLDRNMEIYGSLTPPSYNLTKITIPVSIFVALHDSLAMKEDAKTLARNLPNLLSYNEVPYEKFHHIDFTYGRNVAAGVYMDIIKNIKLIER